VFQRIPEDFLFKESAALFKNPEVSDVKEMKVRCAVSELPLLMVLCFICQLVWKDADEQGVIDFLVKEKGFNLEKVSVIDLPVPQTHLCSAGRLKAVSSDCRKPKVCPASNDWRHSSAIPQSNAR